MAFDSRTSLGLAPICSAQQDCATAERLYAAESRIDEMQRQTPPRCTLMAAHDRRCIRILHFASFLLETLAEQIEQWNDRMMVVSFSPLSDVHRSAMLLSLSPVRVCELGAFPPNKAVVYYII